METRRNPSQALVKAVVAWIDGWHHTERQSKEQQLFSLKQEANLYTRKRYRLFRGVRITVEQREALKSNQPISIPMPTLSSWTKFKLIAQDYAEGGPDLVTPGEGDGIIIMKTDLVPFLDIPMILPLLPDAVDAHGIPDDHMRYAAREGEVIVEHHGPFMSRKIMASATRANVR